LLTGIPFYGMSPIDSLCGGGHTAFNKVRGHTFIAGIPSWPRNVPIRIPFYGMSPIDSLCGGGHTVANKVRGHTFIAGIPSWPRNVPIRIPFYGMSPIDSLCGGGHTAAVIFIIACYGEILHFIKIISQYII